MKAIRRVWIRGAIAGFIGGASIALWFLVIDGLAGQPFLTPAFLASMVTGTETVRLEPGAIALYTALHFGVFLLVGMGVAWAMDRIRTVPGILLGLVLGFLLFDVLFYGSIWFTGVDVVNAIGWPQVLVGSVIGGIALMGSLNLLGPSRNVSWRTVLDEHRIVREGLYAGLIGAGAVAIWFLLLDGMLGRLFFTPGALGSVLFYGADSIAEVRVDALTIIGYSGLHLIAFLTVGLIAAALATEAEEFAAPVLFGAFMLFVVFETFFIGVLAIIAHWLLEVIPWWSIAIANLTAAASMGFYLWREHPALQERFSQGAFEEEIV